MENWTKKALKEEYRVKKSKREHKEARKQSEKKTIPKRLIIHNNSLKQSPRILQKKRILLQSYDEKSMPWMSEEVWPKHLGKLERSISRLKISIPTFQNKGKHFSFFRRVSCHFERIWEERPVEEYDRQKEQKYNFAEYDTEQYLPESAYSPDSVDSYDYATEIKRLKRVFGRNVSKFSKSLKFCSRIKEINLSCAWNNVMGDTFLSRLCQDFKSHRLQTLRLRFCGSVQFPFRFSDIGLKRLSQVLTQTTSLRILYLNFKKRYEITDLKIFSLSKCFRALVSLREIVLNFNGCKQITEEGLSGLLKNLKSCTLLEKLFLNFMGCNKFTDSGVKEIGNLLQDKSLTIKQFGLTLGGIETENNQISEEGIVKLFEKNKPPMNLERICLCFSGMKLDTRTVNSLSKYLKFASNLQHINLNFKNCSRRSLEVEVLENLRNYLISKIEDEKKSSIASQLSYPRSKKHAKERIV